MKSALIATLASFLIASSASAGSGVDFEFTEGGGAISDGSVRAFPLSMGGTVPFIASIELEINGLTHANPWDIDVLLISPQGRTLEILLDRGDQVAVSNIDLLFRDNGAPLPINPDDPLSGPPYSLGAVMSEGTVLIGSTTTGGTGFGDAFVGSSGGTNSWFLVITDDTVNGKEGSFDSFTLRGTVPEPMSLSLLAAGGLALVWRKRR